MTTGHCYTCDFEGDRMCHYCAFTANSPHTCEKCGIGSSKPRECVTCYKTRQLDKLKLGTKRKSARESSQVTYEVVIKHLRSILSYYHNPTYSCARCAWVDLA